MPAISVIVPVYKTEQYLHRCVDSILNQTFSDFELILVDDGSPDNCPAICDEYAQNDSRVRVIHQENQGQAAARNHGVRVAQGQWVSFVDSDDMVHPQLLEGLYLACMEHGTKMAFCDSFAGASAPPEFFSNIPGPIMVFDVNEKTLLDRYSENKTWYWVVWGKLIDIQIVRDRALTEGRIYEDNAIVCQWIYAAGKVAILDVQMYFYCTEPESTMRSKFSMKHADYLWALEQQIVFYHTVGFQEIKRKITISYMYENIKICQKVQDHFGKRNWIIQQKIRCLLVLIKTGFRPTNEQILAMGEFFVPHVMAFYFGIKKAVNRLGGRK